MSGLHYTYKGKRGANEKKVFSFWGSYGKSDFNENLYEKDNHLGSVHVVVSDRKLAEDTDGDGTIDSWKAGVVAAFDYFPYGGLIPGRVYESTSSRHGFGGHERDDEIYGSGNSYTAEFWQYDSRLGRRWNLDPRSIVPFSPYSTFKDNPIVLVDIKGDTTYRFNEDGEFMGMADLNEKGIRGSIGKLKEFESKEGEKFQGWVSERNFDFNDPKVDKVQLNSLDKGDKALQIVKEEEINNIMNMSKIEKSNIFARFLFAGTESGSDRDIGEGSKMDFGVMYLNGKPGGENNDFQGGFFLFGESQRAYNPMDGGNWLWGQSMKRLGFDYSTSLFFSEANEGFSDSKADQTAIRKGFHYDIQTDQIIKFKLQIR